MTVQLNIDGFQDQNFDVVAQVVYPVPTDLPPQPGTPIGRRNITIMCRDVFICAVPAELQNIPKTAFHPDKLDKLLAGTIPVGVSRELFAVPPEALLRVVPSGVVAGRVRLGDLLNK